MLTVLTPATTYDLTTLDVARDELGISGSAQDAAISRLIRQASDAISAHCGQPFGRERVRQEELVPGSSLVLDRSIAPAIETVTGFGLALDPTADYALDGAILRLRGRWGGPWLPCWIAVEYAAGYDLLGDLPYDVERACLLTVAAWYRARGRDPLLRSESVEGVGTLAYATGAAVAAPGGRMLPGEAIDALARFRRLSI